MVRNIPSLSDEQFRWFLKGLFKYGVFQGSAPAPDFPVESDENDVELKFINEDDLPLACIYSGDHFLEYPELEEDLGI